VVVFIGRRILPESASGSYLLGSFKPLNHFFLISGASVGCYDIQKNLIEFVLAGHLNISLLLRGVNPEWLTISCP